jgi:hypothetical protein
MVGIAQLVRASGCGSEGRGFEPHYPPHYFINRVFYADVVKLVYTPDLGSGASRRGGSSPLIRTRMKKKTLNVSFFERISANLIYRDDS